MAHGAAHDAPQHIAAALVRGQDAVGDEKGGGPQVIGDDPVRRLVPALGRNPGLLDDRCDEGAEEIGLIVVMGALEHRGDALEAHAGVD